MLTTWQLKIKRGKIGKERDSPSQTNILDEWANHREEQEDQGDQGEEEREPWEVMLLKPAPLV